MSFLVPPTDMKVWGDVHEAPSLLLTSQTRGLQLVDSEALRCAPCAGLLGRVRGQVRAGPPVSPPLHPSPSPLLFSRLPSPLPSLASSLPLVSGLVSVPRSPTPTFQAVQMNLIGFVCIFHLVKEMQELGELPHLQASTERRVLISIHNRACYNWEKPLLLRHLESINWVF